MIDVTAELPSHFSESLASLGFDAFDGDMLPLERPAPTREQKQKKAAAAAKVRRRARRGERRSRQRN